MSHTPGPWVVVSGIDVCALVGTPEAITVASTQFFEGAPTERQLADARLIAAAPELLAALKGLMGAEWRPKKGPLQYDSLREDAWDAAETAIAKAEGRS